MSATATQAPTAALDLASVREIRRIYDDRRGLQRVEAIYSGHTEYVLNGWSDGTEVTCSCPGFRHRQRCKHATAWPLMLDELERQYQAGKPTSDLIACLDFWERQDTLTNDERRARNAQVAVLAARGIPYRATRTLAEQRRVVERGKRAAEELYG